jgi:hypothetical protein
MRVKGSYRPQPVEFEKVKSNAILRFYENINEITEDGDVPSTGWEYDCYTLVLPFDSGLAARVERDVAAWLAHAKQEEINTLAAKKRSERNVLLTETDWTQLNDAPIDDIAKSLHKVYRQHLRDLPAQAGFPYNVEFPIKPNN